MNDKTKYPVPVFNQIEAGRYSQAMGVAPPAPAKVAGQWVWCGDGGRMPPKNKYVLVARKSGYNGIKYEFMTAQYDAHYKGWTEVSNTRLTDSGDDPCWWFDGELPMLPAEPIAAPPIEPEVIDWKAKYEELAAQVKAQPASETPTTGRKFFGMGGRDGGPARE